MRVIFSKAHKSTYRPTELLAASLLSLALVIMLSPGSTSAADRPTLDKGLMELGGGIALNWVEDLNNQQFSPHFGAFLSRGSEIEIRPIFTRSAYGSSSIWEFWLLGSYYYNFSTESNVVPFIGGGAGPLTVGYAGDTETKFVMSGGGGLKVFMTDRAFMRVEYLLTNVFDEDEDMQSHDIVLGFGLMFGEASL